jgi:arsenite-transporting ATPase
MKTMLELVKPTNSTKYLFFGGKGGVGKTTAAAATAVWMANAGYRTTIVSTDPTVSLSAIFNQEISATEKTKIKQTDNLWGVNINPSEATGVFQKRLSGTLGGLTNMLGGDVISTPCAEEMAAFDQFVEFLDDKDSEVVVFDTAPTGHSLRELAMPFDWSDFLKKQIKNRNELAAVMQLEDTEETIAQLEADKTRYNNAIEVLKDSDKTVYTLVLLPAFLPIEETKSALTDLNKLGVNVRTFIVNQLIPIDVIKGNAFLQKRYQTQEKYMSIINQNFGKGVITTLPMLETDVYDLNTLGIIGSEIYGGA